MGSSMDGIIRDYRYLTGKADAAKWAYGYIQSKEQYYTAKELEKSSVITEINVPLDCGSGLEHLGSGNWGRKFWISLVMGITRNV